MGRKELGQAVSSSHIRKTTQFLSLKYAQL